MNKSKLNELTTWADNLYCSLEDEGKHSETKEFLDELIDFLESIGGRVDGLKYRTGTAIKKLKEEFVDCTYGGEDENYLMNDVGLFEVGIEDSFAHVDFHKNEQKIKVKIYDIDSNLICEEQFRNVRDVVEYLKLDTWRKVWNNRIKLYRADTREQIEKWVSSNQHEYNEQILIDNHPKDAWVAYLEPRP